MKANVNYAYFCHQGLHRPNNEDNYWCCGATLPAVHEGDDKIRLGELTPADLPVLAVLDGMGGESCGEVASYLGARRIGEMAEEKTSLLKDNPKEFLMLSAVAANQAVLEYQEHHRISTMGSTLAAAAFGEQAVCLANLGDSRIYCFQSGTLRQLSVDHVFGRSMFGKPPLTQYLGLPEDEMELQPSFEALPYKGEYDLLLCSDGLSDLVKPEQITQILSSGLSLEDKAAKLLSCALANGGRDNVTAILIHVQEIPDKNNETSDPSQPETRGFWGWLRHMLERR